MSPARLGALLGACLAAGLLGASTPSLFATRPRCICGLCLRKQRP